MHKLEITIFTAPGPLQKYVHGRYICVLRTGDDSEDIKRWIADDSLVDISKELGEGLGIDWAFIERGLLEEGVGHAEVSISDGGILNELFRTVQ
jgi:hypothetical protein